MAKASRLGKFFTSAPGPKHITKDKGGETNEKEDQKGNRQDGMSQLQPNAVGIDIGASEVWVDVGNKDAEPTRMFETFTADLNRMGDWLNRCGIQTVAMESTGVFWIPVCQILESKGIEVYLVNAKQAKNVSGRKSDMLDCQWLRILHSYQSCRRQKEGRVDVAKPHDAGIALIEVGPKDDRHHNARNEVPVLAQPGRDHRLDVQDVLDLVPNGNGSADAVCVDGDSCSDAD